MAKYISTKTYKHLVPEAYRQWSAVHSRLGAQEDPNRKDLRGLGELGIAKITEVEKTGCEGLATWLYEYINTIFLPDYGKDEAARIWCCKVEVRETDSNMAMKVGHREDGELS